MARSRRTPPEIPDLSAQAWLNARGPIHRALKYLVQHLFESLPAPHEETHLVGGSDALQTPGNPVTLDPNLGAVVGAGPSYAREDHRHALDLKLTAKGDLLTRTAAAYNRLPVGLDSFVLTADSTKPEGLSWKAGSPASDGAGVGSLAWPGGADDGSGESWFPGPPGLQGPQGLTGPPGSGSGGGGGMGPPGLDGEDAEYPWVIPGGSGPSGSPGSPGATGAVGAPGTPGMDGQDSEDAFFVLPPTVPSIFASGSPGLVPASGGGTTNFLRADSTFASPGASSTPDIALSLLAPAVDETITAGYSAVLVRKYTIASGKKLTIGLGARMRIL